MKCLYVWSLGYQSCACGHPTIWVHWHHDGEVKEDQGSHCFTQSLGLCWNRRDGGGERGGGGGGRHRKDLQRDSETTKLLFDSPRTERRGLGRHKRNGSFETCPSHHPCPCQAWRRADRRSAQRPSLSFFRCPTACQRKLRAWQGPVATKRMPRHMPVRYLRNPPCPFTPRACGTEWEPYVEKLRRWSVTAAGK